MYGEFTKYSWAQSRPENYRINANWAEAIKRGNVRAMYNFYNRNECFIQRVAFRIISYAKMPFGSQLQQYSVSDVINQIFVDLPFYDLHDYLSFCIGMRKSFKNIGYGGFNRTGKSYKNPISLDTPLNSHSSKMESSDFTLADILCADCDMFDTCFPDHDTVNRDYGELLAYMEKTIKDKCKLNYVFCKTFTNLQDEEIQGGEYEEFKPYIQ